MQQLQFETSWDKALANQDRENIERIFNETKHLNSSTIFCSPIREAINHKEALLVSVLVHNGTDRLLTFINARLLYSIGGEVIADKVFTLPALTIRPGVSMPWTFIFPKDSYTPQIAFENGQLEIL
ncbi:SLAP domain-containing protein [Priestia endophytica]|jgi:SLAP domain-containing protein|uniref:SLAP domain-containing protein n=1 Tax=Priestia endophytica TaxID=135735 RepID=A0AAX1Q6W5_9BACI|nr:SLAP domain-containing protein [Priestia endophytica]KAB2494104.1 SLAP domain-containing protein [Priestia endophytica]MCM3538075.1 SLAP domain-containing protein [Priestia endophytica]RAS76110.1 SLAP domain-containing protein [Priestia endophytica]RAS78833.1 SLAP domain-containing protein [Priestia endophytica]RAS85308.1 SLAP domain-containing protein [Priestia endophytica]